jgi:hypothetical protein
MNDNDCIGIRAHNKIVAKLEADNAALRAALAELIEIVEWAQESNDGKEALDSFTLQPARAALAKEETL